MKQSDIKHSPFGPAASMRRIGAMVLRYLYLIRSSWPRLVELVYWPFVQMLLWGFLQMHLATISNFYAQVAGLLIGSVLLWDILVRSQLGFSIPFLEEMWSRNLGHLLMSPLRSNEYIASLMVVSIVRLMIGMIPVTLLAYVFFEFNVLKFGLALAAFFACLVMTGWALGLAITGVVLRYGLGAEGFTWSVVFVFLPICCVYYPVSTLPGWLQTISLALPPTHVFEGMRAVLIDHTFRAEYIWRALVLNLVYFSIGFYIFHHFLKSARVNGSLVQMGE